MFDTTTTTACYHNRHHHSSVSPRPGSSTTTTSSRGFLSGPTQLIQSTVSNMLPLANMWNISGNCTTTSPTTIPTSPGPASPGPADPASPTQPDSINATAVDNSPSASPHQQQQQQHQQHQQNQQNQRNQQNQQQQQYQQQQQQQQQPLLQRRANPRRQRPLSAPNLGDSALLYLPIAVNNGQSGTVPTRRKKDSYLLNRMLIDQTITDVSAAVEADQQGNHQSATDLYIRALQNMLYAMPIDNDPKRRDALRAKMREYLDRMNMTTELLSPMATQSPYYSSEGINPEKTAALNAYANDKSSSARSQFSDHIINVAIAGAVALKQSPIPDALSATVNYTMKKMRAVDEMYGLQDKAWQISRSGINLALEIDEQYDVHGKISNAMFTGLVAFMKAGIAYKDSPSYRDLKRTKSEDVLVDSSVDPASMVGVGEGEPTATFSES